MSLSTGRVRATIAVSDIARAGEFYEGKLGLTARSGGPEPVRIYPCGGGTVLQVYASPEHAGKATATVASWSVDDLDAVVDELSAKGVPFERYDELDADERGIHSFGEHRVAWFRDPDGNTCAVDNGMVDDAM
jgi:catechol 2,3-dioxygenase-like lactoylglutathione lyase family enzyme